MQLRRLSNADFDEANRLAEMAGIPLTTCPTCGSKPIKVVQELENGEPSEAEGRVCGTYRYMGKVYDCDCKTQMQLRKHYLIANIGDQYMRLDWDDYDGSQEAQDFIAVYLKSWDSAKKNGMGLELTGVDLGTGKTFAATHVGKELVKRGERVYFIPFLDVISLYQKPPEERERLSRRLREVTVLILDEVRPPTSEAQGWLFAESFEALIRHRTNFNLPTIIGTNLVEDELHEHYPRTYSLLAAKQIRIKFDGADNRKGRISDENLELLINDEVRPIT